MTQRRTKQDFAHCMKELVDEMYPDAVIIRVILDQLNTHSKASLYETFEPEEARRIARKLEFHYTPKHGSWLNMAEIKLSVVDRQCLDRWLQDMETVQSEIAAWERPVSSITIQFLEWCCQEIETLGKSVLAMIWDNARWHTSKAVRTWVREHNRAVKRTGKGARILVCFLPVKSPWLNPIEPKWAHGKRRIVESNATLSKQALADRICATFGCLHLEHLSIPENVS